MDRSHPMDVLIGAVIAAFILGWIAYAIMKNRGGGDGQE